MIANCISCSRILFSISLFVLSPSSVPFAVLYLLCGLSDVADGYLARKLHTESRAGERLDSIADLFFAAAYAVKIFPLLCLPIWIWIWTAFIAVIKTAGILMISKKEGRFNIAHSITNKLTGLLIFLLPLTICFIEVKYSAAVVCAVATVAATEEVLGFWMNRKKKYCR